MNVIRSHKHQICTETVNKIALSKDDDKRVIEADGINTNMIIITDLHLCNIYKSWLTNRFIISCIKKLLSKSCFYNLSNISIIKYKCRFY